MLALDSYRALAVHVLFDPAGVGAPLERRTRVMPGGGEGKVYYNPGRYDGPFWHEEANCALSVHKTNFVSGGAHF